MSIFPLSNYHKFLISKTFLNFYLRGAIATLYLMSRQMDVSQAMWLISFYSILVVLLEYPTGVIGDTYGHKTSVVRGSLFYGLGMLLMCLELPWYLYTIPLAINALGSSLESGSDVGLFKSIVPDFKKVYPGYRSYTLLVQFAAAIVTGYLFTIAETLPVLLTGVMCLCGALTFSMIIPQKKPDTKISSQELSKGNIFATAKQGLIHIFTSPLLIIMLVSFAITNGYIGSAKTIINSMYEFFDVHVLRLTYAVGLVFIARAGGAYISKWLSEKYIGYIPIIISGATICMSILTYTLSNADWWYILTYFVICALLISAVNSLMIIYISTTTTSAIISSTLSMYKLASRLFTAIYLFGAGYVLRRFDISTLFLMTAIIFIAISLMNVLFALHVHYHKTYTTE